MEKPSKKNSMLVPLYPYTNHADKNSGENGGIDKVHEIKLPTKDSVSSPDDVNYYDFETNKETVPSHFALLGLMRSLRVSAVNDANSKTPSINSLESNESSSQEAIVTGVFRRFDE